MVKSKLVRPLLFLAPVAIGCAVILALPVRITPSQVPVSLTVSVEAKHGGIVPTIEPEDVRIVQGKTRLQETEWLALQGRYAQLELFVLLDDSISPTVSLQFEDLRQFMNAQPSTTAVAVGYIRNGTVEIVQNFTTDHVQAGKALRMPLGVVGISSSPYLAISDLMSRWPRSNTPRREIVIVSSGVDYLYGGGPNDPYLSSAIDQAQREGIQIYAIFASAAGHAGHSFFQFNWGQNNLAQLTDETGSEFYVEGFQTPIAFKPYLNKFAERLTHQYRLTFLAAAQQKATYQKIRLATEVENAELIAQDRVYVPPAK
jgi:hypothetical protein